MNPFNKKYTIVDGKASDKISIEVDSLGMASFTDAWEMIGNPVPCAEFQKEIIKKLLSNESIYKKI